MTEVTGILAQLNDILHFASSKKANAKTDI